MESVINPVNPAAQYAEWLRERITAFDRGAAQVVSTPFLDPFHDGIQVHLDPAANGEVLLHDGGHTLEVLSDLGVRIEESERRQTIIQRATAGCGVRFRNGQLETTATASNLPQRLHFLLTAVLRLNDLWMSAVPHRFTDFFEMVAEFLDQHQVAYNANISIPGRTIDHPIDFAIPLPKRRERLIKLVSAPTPQTAKLISFTWMELQESRPEAERVVVMNDLRVPDPLDDESDEDFRNVSEQTISILRGYSTRIYRWSERKSNDFQSLWLPA
ncbi:MAG: DUF1828 domain-containing protein [Terrimicrobiaceae bacterium]|nr:DUF1828 domain-containing protein [Terrimicrobiaceae bacterium]